MITNGTSASPTKGQAGPYPPTPRKPPIDLDWLEVPEA